MARLARQAQQNSDRFLERFPLEASASFDDVEAFLRARYIYRFENEEIVRTPGFQLNDLETIGHIEGDCDDISTLAAALLKALGYRVRFTAIRYSPDVDAIEHVFVEALDGGSWRIMDLTVPQGTVYEILETMIEDI